MVRIRSEWPTASDSLGRSVAAEFLLRDAPKEDEDEEEDEDEGNGHDAGDEDEDSGEDEDGYSE